MNHLGDTNKMVSETPRMKAAQMAAMEHGTGDVWRVGCDIERELNAANVEIERLTAKVAQLYEGGEEQKQRIKRLEDELMDMKNKHAVLVADVVLNEDRAERIKRVEEERRQKP
jgi:cupin superfamily acireductone dioxygenase involved in methionine salvage